MLALSAQADPPVPTEEEDFDLLSTKIAELVEDMDADLKGCSIYLVGMMGCGKSTLGRMLSNTLKYNFFDSDTMVEKTHDDKSVADIFKEYGQDYFRDCESQVRSTVGMHAHAGGRCLMRHVVLKMIGGRPLAQTETPSLTCAQVLKALAPHTKMVVATGGGAVLRPMNWSYMQQVRRATTAAPEEEG